MSIDITPRNAAGTCDLKCAYTFDYPTSSSTLSNKGIFIGLSYDAATMSPVTYNQAPYSVAQIQIYAPSLHTFGGVAAAAEIMIIHTPQKGGDNLYVCIPVIVGGKRRNVRLTSISRHRRTSRCISSRGRGINHVGSGRRIFVERFYRCTSPLFQLYGKQCE